MQLFVCYNYSINDKKAGVLFVGNALYTYDWLNPRYASKIWNAALFLREGILYALIRHKNGTFRGHSSNRRNLKSSALRFSADGKHFNNRAFCWRSDNQVISLSEFSSNDRWLGMGGAWSSWCLVSFFAGNSLDSPCLGIVSGPYFSALED